MKYLLLCTTVALIAVSTASAATSFWTKRQAEQRVVSIVPHSVNPLHGTLRRQCAGFRRSQTSSRLFSRFSCILQRKDGSFLIASIKVISPTRAYATNVSCVHYAKNTTGPRACRK